jgi:hypothetical protein
MYAAQREALFYDDSKSKGFTRSGKERCFGIRFYMPYRLWAQ